ncbi:MAG: phytoene/squalene synthase family protein [Solirubrobacteraceae bacterium]|nr:phytoene/squalene synthase family protein [Solirubrobacteraceae bacterium]
MRDADLVAAKATTRRVARTFALACRLLPRHIRDDVYLLYLVFRTLDDAVDLGEPDAAGRLAAVEAWAAGEPAGGREVRVLDALAQRHPLPRREFAAFCAGMRDDLDGRPILDESELDRYCYRVAGTVGVVMAHVLGMHDPRRAEPAAAALGMAMQRTNILRDIDEDLGAGRVYIARSTLERLGGSLEPGRREALLRDQIARADALYDQGCAGIELLASGQRAIAAAAAMYREILRQIEREGYGARPGRAVVPRRRKLLVATIGR